MYSYVEREIILAHIPRFFRKHRMCFFAENYFVSRANNGNRENNQIYHCEHVYTQTYPSVFLKKHNTLIISY